MKAPWLLRLAPPVVFLIVGACSGNANGPSPPKTGPPASSTVPPSTVPPLPWTGPVQVAGVVRDFRSDAAIAGAHVSFNNFDNVTIGTAATTDSSGTYSLMAPSNTELAVTVDGEGVTTVTLKDRIYRGDFYVHHQNCVARYGMVIDSVTRFPVFGATVSVGGNVPATATTTDGTGWFRLSLGCDTPAIGFPIRGCIGSNTTLATVTHPDYLTGSFVVGRGICDVERMDWALHPR